MNVCIYAFTGIISFLMQSDRQNDGCPFYHFYSLRVLSFSVPVCVNMTAALYSWMSADLDPTTEPYNLVGRIRFKAKANMVKPVRETSANGRWQHNQQLKHKLAVNTIKDNLKNIWNSNRNTQVS